MNIETRNFHQRQSQAISVLISLSIFLVVFFSTLLTIAILNTKYWWLILFYCIWLYIDRKAPESIKKRKKWIGYLPWWRKTGEYFPVKMVKTENFELEPTKNYLFCSYPHGIVGFSMLIQFLDDQSDMYKLFPRFNFTLGTIGLNYYVPFCREVTLAFNCCSVTKSSLINHLSCPEGGQGVILMVGGSSEAAFCQPGVHKIILNDRKGFIKIALQSGSPLVLIYHFGLSDTYNQVVFTEESLSYKMQQFLKKILGFNPLIPRGVGFLGILPNRVPIFSVVGKPIEVPKIINPTKDDVEEFHQIFKTSMLNLFETEKYKYLSNPEETKLIIV